ncbi:MAG: TonB-dependent receptor [Gammaproteobacteria bacterium]|nr:TonB-dependent receptor [Gammaproteobacteria bacterium]MCY4254833.1 TonB-dependent receptor [Gammaproteobacteria bacterium]
MRQYIHALFIFTAIALWAEAAPALAQAGGAPASGPLGSSPQASAEADTPPVGARVSADDRPASALEEVVVTASLKEMRSLDLPSSVTVLDAQAIRNSAVQHFEELAQLTPNLHWAGGSSRARYFQVRGIGERSQYEGAPNPSVGFLLDDIDFSAIGGVATRFDLGSVEILRGPQGTRYGANALAGLIYARSREPSRETEAEGEISLGNDAMRSAGLALSGPLGPAAAGRFSAHRYQADGFRRNATLDRNDTNARKELSLRAKLNYQPSPELGLRLTLLRIDLDNGYDGWSIDNELTTWSDRPGRDSQTSTGASLRADYALVGGHSLVSITGAANSDIEHSYDADWGEDGYWSEVAGLELRYDYTSRTLRERSGFSQELRLLSPEDGETGYVLGVWLLNLDEDNDRIDTGLYAEPGYAPGPSEDRFNSGYGANNLALFGELSRTFADQWLVTAGLRWERRDADYTDSAGERFSPADDMLGGHLSLSRPFGEDANVYARIARGYKAGGFNLGLGGRGLASGELLYEPEYLWNYEIGAKGLWLDGRLRGELAVFHSQRADVQVETNVQVDPQDPNTFLFFTRNVGRGVNRGIELAVDYRPVEAWRVSAALGLLDTEITRNPGRPELEGRDQPHAPGYGYALGALWRHPQGWFAGGELTGKDGFYFSNSHDRKSSAHTLLNLRAGRTWNGWEAFAWARNLLDEYYAVRGFFFANVPPDWPEQEFRQQGDPRHFGVTIRRSF